MSYYFSKKSFAAPKLDSVLARDEKLTKNINEIVRRKGISASAPKKKKRKPKSKGKHRKGKKIKTTDKGEITITNDPTQRVSGYSVVNVISAKRGPYKKQQPIGPPGATKAKGSFGRSGAVRTGLMASASDNIQFRDPAFGTGDGGQREELRGLRRQVDRIEQRINGMGNLPAQQNPSGPLGNAPAPPQHNAPHINPGGGGGGNAPPPPQQHGFNNLFLPPPPLPPPSFPPPPPPPRELLQPQQPLTPTPRTKEQEKKLARELNISVQQVRNMTDDEFVVLLASVLEPQPLPLQSGGTAGPEPFISSGGAVNNPQGAQAALERERQLKARGTPRQKQISQQKPVKPSGTLGDALKAALGEAPAPEPETQPRKPSSLHPKQRLQKRAEAEAQGLPSADSLTLESPVLTPRQQAAEEAFLERQAKVKPVGRVRGVDKKKARAALLADEDAPPPVLSQPPTPASAPVPPSPAVSIPGTPFALQSSLAQFVKPIEVGEEVGQPARDTEGSPKPVPVKSPVSGLPLAVGKPVSPGSGLPVVSPINKAEKNASRYGTFKPDASPTIRGYTRQPGRRTTGARDFLSDEWYDEENRKQQISTQLRNQFGIPDDFFMKSKGKLKVFRTGPAGQELQLSRTMFTELRNWGKRNLTEDQQRFLNDKIDEWNTVHIKQAELRKRDEKAFKQKEIKKLEKKKETTPLYNISEAPAPEAEESKVSKQLKTMKEAMEEAKQKAELGASGVLVPSTETIPLPSNVNPEGGISGAAAGAASAVVGGAASLAGGLVQGAVQGIASQLPTAGQVGQAIGQGAVIGAGALVRGGAGAVSGGYQMITAPSDEPSPEI
tara:strand:+ start:2171 stop:4678 length:2508 start_codon:yes stop_codon:yes gene_type:complete